jgi:hypothetical protein
MYEPYTIAPRAVRYDEHFQGRHLNKNMHIWDLACAGLRFRVLRDCAVFHRNSHKLIPYVDSDFQTMRQRWSAHVTRALPQCKAVPSGTLGGSKRRPAESCLQVGCTHSCFIRFVLLFVLFVIVRKRQSETLSAGRFYACLC